MSGSPSCFLMGCDLSHFVRRSMTVVIPRSSVNFLRSSMLASSKPGTVSSHPWDPTMLVAKASSKHTRASRPVELALLHEPSP